jgi:hypothetical protein
MTHYLVCEKRGNHPRIHVKICECRCQEAETCPTFKAYVKARKDEASAMMEQPFIESSAEEALSLTTP